MRMDRGRTAHRWSSAARTGAASALALLLVQGLLWLMISMFGAVGLFGLAAPLALLFLAISYPTLWLLNVVTLGSLASNEVAPDPLFLAFVNCLVWAAVAFVVSLVRHR